MWTDQRPLQGNVSYIALPPGQYVSRHHLGKWLSVYLLIHTLICRLLQKKLPILSTVKFVTFTCGIRFCFLIITQNVITFIVVDIYNQDPTLGEFLNPHMKNTILWYVFSRLILHPQLVPQYGTIWIQTTLI